MTDKVTAEASQPAPLYGPLEPSAQAELDARRAKERHTEEETLGAWRAGRDADTAPKPILRSDLQSLTRHSALSVWALAAGMMEVPAPAGRLRAQP
jgi:hypothetical protein